jgi:exopolysaccharide biosynthesis polyprenyl glycosylphosphotransferase
MTVTATAETGPTRRSATLLRPRPSPDGRHQTPWLFRAPVGVYLLGVDCLSFFASTATRWPPRPWQLLVLIEMCAFLGGVGKLYRSRLTLSVLDDFPYVLGAVFICLLTEISLETITGDEGTSGRRAIQMVALLVLVLVLRSVAYALVRRARRSGLVRHRVLVLGAGQVGTHLVRTLQQHTEYGLDPVGYWDRHPRTANQFELLAPLFGADERLADVIQDFAVELVIIAFSRAPESDLVDVLRTCDRLDCEIYVVPRLFELHAITHDMDDAWGIPLAHIRRAPFRTMTWQFKRLIDVVFAATALLLLSPVLAACYLAVRLEGGPGVIFRQERVGLDGHRLTLMKFRSLRPVNDHDSATTWNVAHDLRLGNVGRFLRRTSLDELPQLWNVLTGEMSLVGPRPERPHFADQFARTVPRYTSRHRVPAGLTGWAQVHGLRGDTSIEDRAMFDNTYVENWSLWGDIKIMLRTLKQVVGRTGG